MRVLQVIAGVVFLLVALFTGGCSLLSTFSFLVDGDPYGLWPVALVGYVVAAGTGIVGWLALRGTLDSGATDDGGG